VLKLKNTTTTKNEKTIYAREHQKRENDKRGIWSLNRSVKQKKKSDLLFCVSYGFIVENRDRDKILN
jgi:hypothetical protein